MPHRIATGVTPGPRHLPRNGTRPLRVAADHPHCSRQYPGDRGRTHTVQIPLAFAPLDIQRKRYQKPRFLLQSAAGSADTAHAPSARLVAETQLLVTTTQFAHQPTNRLRCVVECAGIPHLAIPACFGHGNLAQSAHRRRATSTAQRTCGLTVQWYIYDPYMQVSTAASR